MSIFHSDVTLTHIDPKFRFAFGSCDLDGSSVYIGKAQMLFLGEDAREGYVIEMRLKVQDEDTHGLLAAYEALGIVNDDVDKAARSYADLMDQLEDFRQRLSTALQRITELEDLECA